MRGVLISLIRHAAAIFVGWLTVKLALTPDQATQATEAFVALAGVIILGAYALGEKLLKPLFFRYFGELLPGEVPPAKHDLEKAKAEAVTP